MDGWKQRAQVGSCYGNPGARWWWLEQSSSSNRGGVRSGWMYFESVPKTVA